MDKQIIAENIKTLRKAFSETQQVLAEMVCHVDRTLVVRWERGTRTPDSDMIKILANHYGVTPDSLVNKKISAEMDWSTGNIIVSVEPDMDESENAFLNSVDMTPYLIEGISEDGKKKFQRLMIMPRIGLAREAVYEAYKRAYLLDEEIDTNLSDERMTRVVEDYWYAYDNGIEEAGVNLLRIFFLYNFTESSGKGIIKQRIRTLIDGLKLADNPAGEYYEALCIQWGVFKGKTTDPYYEGAEIIEELADNMNIYAMRAKDFLFID